MDRNLWWGVRKAVGSLVALRKESVDRNRCAGTYSPGRSGSLSARRAWIEIYERRCFLLPLKESLSARRAWIEIARFARSACVKPVALRKESVDRNFG